MAELPKKYAFLALEGGPKMLVAALAKFGTREIPGIKSNPELLAWAKEIGLQWDYTADEIPWCGLFMGACAWESGWKLPSGGGRSPLRAKDWLTFGNAAPVPMLGDVLVFGRTGGGHVGMYIGEDATHFHVLGGNQGNVVCIARFPKNSASFPFLGVRRAAWKQSQPLNVRRIFINANGVDTSVSVV